jgi:PAS domain S-box-containing protein
MAGQATVLAVTDGDVGAAWAAADADLSVRVVADAAAARDALTAPDAAVDCVVAGHDPPALEAGAVVRTVVDHAPGVPVVVATAAGSEELAGEVVAAGAAGYVPCDLAAPSETLTERVRVAASSTANRSVEQYETIMETVPVGVFVLDEEGRGLSGNRLGARMLGRPYGDLVGTRIADLVEEGVFEWSVVETYLDTVRDLLSDETDTTVGEFEFEAHPEPGETRIYEARTALRPPADEFNGVIGVMRDVTERERRREELERYETIISSLADPVWVTDGDGYGTYINPAYEERYGWTQAEVEAGEVHFEDTVTDADAAAIRELVDDLVDPETDTERETLEVEIVTKEGRRVPAEDTFGVLPFDDEFRGMAGVARDVTDRKRRQRRIQVLNRVLRHDLGNDMNLIAGTADELASEATDPEQEARAETIRRVAEELIDTSRQVRRLEGIIDHDRSERRALDLRCVVDAAVDDLRWASPEATFDVDGPSVAVEGHEGLQHAVEQVVENAVEHSERADPRVEVTVDPGAEWVALHVADDGPGLPESDRAVVADDEDITPLTHGSGLGLWVVRWVVESLDGEMAITDREGGGSVVTVRLRPAAEGE